MSTLRVGDWVEVRSKEEILRSLDKNGRLEGLPFMPQMFQYCGRRFRLYKRAHKTCDTVTNDCIGRHLPGGVHLDLRCDGQAHGGCQAACLLFWKEAWLKPVRESEGGAKLPPHVEPHPNRSSAKEHGCTEDDVWKAPRADDPQDREETRYVCQATELPNFTSQLPWYDLRQYLEDYRSGNVSLRRLLDGFAYVTYHYGTLAFRGRIGAPARWLYDRIQGLWGGIPYPRRTGTLPDGQPVPMCTLNLQPGELVRVKSYPEILATMNKNLYHRGLMFDAELVPYCGGTYRVRARINKFIDEKTGKMRTLKTPAVMLDGVCCQSRYSYGRMFCPRSIFSWWREIWLERIEVADAPVRPLEPALDAKRSTAASVS
jgi:hypothetical protein